MPIALDGHDVQRPQPPTLQALCLKHPFRFGEGQGERLVLMLQQCKRLVILLTTRITPAVRATAPVRLPRRPIRTAAGWRRRRRCHRQIRRRRHTRLQPGYRLRDAVVNHRDRSDRHWSHDSTSPTDPPFLSFDANSSTSSVGMLWSSSAWKRKTGQQIDVAFVVGEQLDRN